jgi:hypothetical protein
MWKPICVTLSCAVTLCARAQGTNTAGAVHDYPSQTIQFGQPTPTTLGSRGTVMSGLTACSDDGVAFVLMIDDISTAEMVVHSVEADGKSIPYHALRLISYRDITTARRFFASDR